MTDKNCKTCAIKKYFIPEIIIVLAVLALDIFLKKYSEKYLINNPKVFIPGVINLVYVENRGAAFGIFQNALAFFIILTIIALAAFIFFLYKKRDGHFLLRLALVLIISGTAGNFIDRVKAGYVIDMIELDFMEFAIFNIADSALTVGTVLFAIYYLFIYKEPVKEPVKQAVEAVTGDDINNE
jgi:signal peptidase II